MLTQLTGRIQASSKRDDVRIVIKQIQGRVTRAAVTLEAFVSEPLRPR